MKGKDRTENIADLAEAWYKGEFDLGYYNFYICTTAEGLIQKCKDGHKIKVTCSDIENMCKLDLLEYILNKKDGKKMFPQFIADRVAFIKELQATFNYPIPRLQQIIAYENEMLPYSNEACDFYYADRKNIMSWIIKRLKFERDGRKEYLKTLDVINKKYADDVKAIQLKILEKRNAVNLVKETQNFLLRLRSKPNNEQMDYLVKTFMRIIFKAIYIQNQEIVKHDLNEPWKTCYEEGMKWLKTQEMTSIKAKQAEKARRSYVYYCVPSDVRWCKYRDIILGILKGLSDLE